MLKSKIIQKPQFLSTLLANFCYLSITKLVSDGKWPNFGHSPLWKTFLILEHSVSLRFYVKSTQQPSWLCSLCSKNQKVFQRGASPRYCRFPSETILVVIKYQKLAKSVEGNWGFWIIFDFKIVRLVFRGYYSWFIQMALWN